MEPTQAIILVRGLPGTGRKLLAKQLLASMAEVAAFIHLDTDEFFTNEQGEYHYVKGCAGEAHRFTRLRMLKALNEERNVIVSSSFVTIHELVPYIRIARERGLGLFLSETVGTPEPTESQPTTAVLESMRRRWQRFSLDGYNIVTTQERIACHS